MAGCGDSAEPTDSASPAGGPKSALEHERPTATAAWMADCLNRGGLDAERRSRTVARGFDDDGTLVVVTLHASSADASAFLRQLYTSATPAVRGGRFVAANLDMSSAAATAALLCLRRFKDFEQRGVR
jgi:hypothetical protein